MGGGGGGGERPGELSSPLPPPGLPRAQLPQKAELSHPRVTQEAPALGDPWTRCEGDSCPVVVRMCVCSARGLSRALPSCHAPPCFPSVPSFPHCLGPYAITCPRVCSATERPATCPPSRLPALPHSHPLPLAPPPALPFLPLTFLQVPSSTIRMSPCHPAMSPCHVLPSPCHARSCASMQPPRPAASFHLRPDLSPPQPLACLPASSPLAHPSSPLPFFPAPICSPTPGIYPPPSSTHCPPLRPSAHRTCGHPYTYPLIHSCTHIPSPLPTSLFILLSMWIHSSPL